jgi:hypothetical protein
MLKRHACSLIELSGWSYEIVWFWNSVSSAVAGLWTSE